ncbi:Fumarate hydratase class I, aerobic [Aduncisulcus paluster]|uniref:fumarate hydratase n=1 Tax=Aduncisulcus paluster TaxID=2918883 RepID=A0ABQ5K8A6_9EUKA|nr:Fumarate hydratase class I, aerobic [Aduncisulcus paluster]|eukprot:gnl/Carplike_NY0171/2497_a3356_737.p1 GENE.gnl/Carplike_NY0171/2497_a3356_737~~gnl/Carplike_NY0171/2497_a3356_737.p1  ORF type:complete len:582 (+),score=194.95 gnl/Carplike_NY0171/2497_a3356_737:46-1791(+)
MCEYCSLCSYVKDLHFPEKSPEFHYEPLVQHRGPDTATYELLTVQGVDIVKIPGTEEEFVRVSPEVIRRLSFEAIKEISFFQPHGHLKQIAAIMTDPDASDNDRTVAREFLVNATVAAQGKLPTCQDTGTAICIGYRGQRVLTAGEDKKHLSRGIYDAYGGMALRYSQVAPLTMFSEKNTGTNLPAQIELHATDGGEYHFRFIAKGGGSANKFKLFQKTKALLTPAALTSFIRSQLPALGTAACPPYHIAFVIGGLSAEQNMGMLKKASAHFLDDLPFTGNEHGRAFRDLDLEREIEKMCQDSGIGAQFGGIGFALDVRVIRLPRHGASCPVSIGVSCAAHRQCKAKITREGVYIERLEHNPAQILKKADEDLAELMRQKAKVVKKEGGEDEEEKEGGIVSIDLDKGMDDICAQLTRHTVGTRLSLNGTLIVARDMAHLKLAERLEATGSIPDYIKDHPVYYAGPAKKPEGFKSGSIAATTAQRMDPYVPLFQPHGGCRVTIAKGQRGDDVTASCKEYGGFYLGTIGGTAARVASQCIQSIDCVEFEELGMEAVWKLVVKDLPAFLLVDDKGNDFFKTLGM